MNMMNKCAKFHKNSLSGKKVKSIQSPERDFRSRRFFFYEIFSEDASPLLLYHGAKKSKITKNSNQGGRDGRLKSNLGPYYSLKSFLSVLSFFRHAQLGSSSGAVEGVLQAQQTSRKSFRRKEVLLTHHIIIRGEGWLFGNSGFFSSPFLRHKWSCHKWSWEKCFFSLCFLRWKFFLLDWKFLVVQPAVAMHIYMPHKTQWRWFVHVLMEANVLGVFRWPLLQWRFLFLFCLDQLSIAFLFRAQLEFRLGFLMESAESVLQSVIKNGAISQGASRLLPSVRNRFSPWKVQGSENWKPKKKKKKRKERWIWVSFFFWGGDWVEFFFLK